MICVKYKINYIKKLQTFLVCSCIIHILIIFLIKQSMKILNEKTSYKKYYHSYKGADRNCKYPSKH